jgi:protein SMG8
VATTVLHRNPSKFDVASLSLALSELSQPDDIFHQRAEQVASPSGDKQYTTGSHGDNDDDDNGDNMPSDDGNDVDASGSGGGDVHVEAESPVHMQDTVLPGVTQRQHSTTEYLPGMLHSNSPPGLLPKFPSWSLLMLGEYASYNPLQGVDQPGFTHGCNFLLPVDVSVKVDREKWMATGDGSTLSKKGFKLRKGTKDLVDVSLRLYIGLEYECPRGHRFFLCAPDRIFRVPPSGLYKETGHRVLNHDMPLYFPCTCRSAKLLIGQLMRVHIAVPDGPVEAKIRPKVQPGIPPCPLFFPEADDPIVLQSGVWVLRLPYVYLGENGPYRMPTLDPQNVMSCKFLRGFLSVMEPPSAGS